MCAKKIIASVMGAAIITVQLTSCSGIGKTEISEAVVTEISTELATENFTETAAVDKDEIRRMVTGSWYDSADKLVGTFFESGNSELSFDMTMTHFEITDDGTMVLSDRYSNTLEIKYTTDKDTALGSASWYYVDEIELIIDKKELMRK